MEIIYSVQLLNELCLLDLDCYVSETGQQLINRPVRFLRLLDLRDPSQR